MAELLRPDQIEQLLRSHGIDPRRSLGQNFLIDPTVAEDIAAAAGIGPGDRVVEVGPGLGSLTLALADTGASVLALEKDRQLPAVLAAVLAERNVDNVELITADAVEVDWSSVLEGSERPWSFVANLPYNVAVPIVMAVLERAPMVVRLVVMVQREVAERLVAAPGGRTIGVPTIKAAWYARSEIVFEVPPEAFSPRPKVTSAVVRMTRTDPPATDVTVGEVMALVRTAYGQRRKMLRTSLGSSVTPEVFAAAGIAGTDRPERLELAQWCDLARAVREQRGSTR